MSRVRVPETISSFDVYINNTDKFLQAALGGSTPNWERLGLSSQNADDWNSKRVYWRDDLYKKYGNPELSTSIVKKQVRDFMKDFRAFANPLLNIMAANPKAVIADELIFRFKTKKSKPTHKTTSIEETVMFDVQIIGGGDLHFNCRVAHDAKRASKAKGADSLQMAFCITDIANNPFKLGTGKPMPTPLDENMKTEIFTKALFTLRTGAGNVGKGVIVFLRWYNTRHPLLSGPWSTVRFFVIG